MRLWLQKATGKSGGRDAAFTLLELLVVMAVIGVLTATILPALAKAKQRGYQSRCMSNMKQVGIAIQLYVSDNDDTLPGPVWSGARASYDKNSSQELVWFLADYLDSQDPASVPANKPVVAEVFVCPAYQHYAPPAPSMVGRKCFLLNDNVNLQGTTRVPPFGYPEILPPKPPAPPIPPLKIPGLETYCSPANTFAMKDVDLLNIDPSATEWWQDVPTRPAHVESRNELYFDYHVAARPVDW